MKELSHSLVYVAVSADTVHPGHLNVIAEARKLGRVVVGLLTDRAIASYKRLPYLTFEEREIVIRNIRGVEDVVPQDTLDYVPNLRRLRPQFVVHGDDWKKGLQAPIRRRVIKALREWDGVLIEVPYTTGISSTEFNRHLRERGTTPSTRMKRFKRLMDSQPLVRILEAHNGITGLIVENTELEVSGMVRTFDGIWVSSLTESLARGKPDMEFDMTSRMDTIDEILDVTTKPIIVDGDSGGHQEHFVFLVRTLERLGVSAVVIEDKIGLKRNSLSRKGRPQVQDSLENFSRKIAAGKHAQVTDDFMILARIESLVLGRGIEDALRRAGAYLDAGADGIMIHSRDEKASEIIEFCKSFRRFNKRIPLVVAPTTYDRVTDKTLAKHGANVVIYANQLLRAAYPSMLHTATLILRHGRALEARDNLISVDSLFEIIPETNQND